MRKLLIIFCSVLLFACSGNKVMEMKNDATPLSINKNKGHFDKLLKSAQDNLKEIEENRDDYQNIYLGKEFDFESENMTRKVMNKTIVDLENQVNYINPSVSFDGRYLLSYKRITVQNKKTTYKLELLHLDSNNKVTLSETNIDQFKDEYQKITPQYDWCPIANMFTFTSVYRKSSNVFVAFAKYNQLSFNIEYSIFQITKNKDNSIIYIDPQLSDDGTMLAFTKLKEGENSQVVLYDFKSKKQKTLGSEEDDIRGFRFGIYDKKMGAIIKKDGNKYNAYLIKRYEKQSSYNKMRKINANGNDKPFLKIAFGEFSERIAVLNYRNDSVEVSLILDYNLGEKILENVKIDHITKDPYIINSPFFMGNDNVLVGSSHEKIFYIFTSEKSFEDNDFQLGFLISARYINSLSRTANDQIFYSVYSGDFKVKTAALNINTTLREGAIATKFYSLEIIEFDEELKTATLKRKKTVSNELMQNKTGIPSVTVHTKTEKIARRKDYDLFVPLESTKNFKQGNEIIVEWPSKTKVGRKAEVKVTFGSTSTQSGTKKKD